MDARGTLLPVLFVVLVAAPAHAGQTSAPTRIAWFATWESGRAEARRTGRPILLVSAAPHCHNVSGLW